MACLSLFYACISCTATECLACDTVNGYVLNGASNICILCSAYYPDCLTCDSFYCLSCPPGFTLDSTGTTCALCDYTCLECSNTSYNCTTCNYTYFRSLNFNSCPADSGYFDAGVPTCQPCDYTCLNCSGPSAMNCSSCNSADFRTFEFTNNSCPPNPNYFDVGTATTVACSLSQCLQCSSLTTCLLCD